MDKVVHMIESVADDAWVPWAGCLVPNIARRIREKVEAKDREEKERKIRVEAEAKERLVREEAERVVRVEAERIARREKRQQEKLDLFLNESITAEEFERDSEAEAERSEIVEDVAGEDALGMQTSEMEVDDVGEDEVVVEDKGSKGGRKHHLRLPSYRGNEHARRQPLCQNPLSSRGRTVVQAWLPHANSAANTTSSVPPPMRELDA